MKALQLFTNESLELSKSMSSDEIMRFLEEFRLLHLRYGPSAYDSLENDKPKKIVNPIDT